MMSFLRRSVSGWMGKLILGLLLGVFAVAWTVADGFSGRASPNTVLTAGGTTVTLQDYQLAYQQALARVSQQLQRRPSPEEAEAFGVDQQALSQLSTGAVLDEQGRVLGLGLSEEGLLRLIAEDPSFQDSNGNFSRTAFSAVLRNAGLTETAYLDRLGETALRSQIVEAVADNVPAPRTLQTAIGLYAGERRTVSYVNVAPPAADTVADPSEEELAAFFEAEAPNFAAPEYRSFAYVNLDAEAVADPASISQEDLEADYEANRQRFTTPERRQVRQIVFADSASAEQAASAAADGASLEDIAASAGRAPTDLGLVSRDQIPDATVADAAFELNEGEISAPVAGIFGPVILQVTQIEPESVRPLEDVADQLRQELALDRAGDRVNEAYNLFEDARAGGATVAEAATEASLTVETVENVSAGGLSMDGTPAQLPDQGELLEAVFETQPNFDNAPLNYESNSYLFYDVTEVTEARDRPLQEVRDAVVAAWKEEEAATQAEERAQALRERIEGGETLQAVAAAEGLTVQQAPAVTRSTGFSQLGEATLNAAFSGAAGKVDVAPALAPGEWTVLVVDEVAPPADPMASVPQGQAEQLSGSLRNDILQSYVSLLQNEYPVRYNSAAVEAAQSTF